MAMTAEVESTTSAVLYQEVKAWIAQQEAFEAQYNKPAPLTDVQRLALEVLRLPAATPSPTPFADADAATVDDDGINYVGNLMEYHQMCGQLDDLHYEDELSGTLPLGVTGRVCRVRIAGSLEQENPIEHFPALGYGLKDDGSEPRFPSKKAAKRFAAKCAVEWLTAQGLMPSHLQAPSPPPKVQSHLLVTPTLKRATQNTNSPTPPPPKQQDVTEPSGFDGNFEATTMSPSSPGATELVSSLCRELNFPAPRYDIVVNAQNTYDGTARFDDYGEAELLSLTRASLVHGMAGKDATRKAVVAKVLKKLREIAAGRDTVWNTINAHLDGLPR